MNKTVTINLSGIVFYIEEQAFEMLNHYLAALRNGFAAEDGRDEIMADIESRIAEMFQGKLNPSKQVIVQTDVEEVIEIMGRPETFQTEEEANTDGKKTTEEQTEYGQKRYRRLYRDTEDKVVGGVCSGIGHYFEIDPVWIRAAFAIAFFAFGTGFLLYIILMIIIPKARSTSERLEMKGERVTVDSISRTIREEFEDFKHRMSGLSDEAKQYGKDWKERQHQNKKNYKSYYTKYDASDRRANRDFFDRIGSFIIRAFGMLMLVFGILFLFGLLTKTFNVGILNNGDFGPIIHSVFADRTHYVLAVMAFFLIIGIPLMMMIYKGIRIVFKIQQADRPVNMIAGGLWLAGVALAIYVGITTSDQFSTEGRERTVFAWTQPVGDTLTVMVNIDPQMENEKKTYHFGNLHMNVSDWEDFHYDGKVLKLGNPELNIVKSESGQFEVYVYKYARGTNKIEALERVRQMNYHLEQRGTQVWLDNYLTAGSDNAWRKQEVKIEVRVPEGKYVKLSTQTAKMISNVDNVQNIWDPEMAGHYWQMTSRGLSCADCSAEDIKVENKSRLEDSTKHANDSLEATIKRMSDSIRNAAKKK